ncbi:hypothetical protein [Sorangium sp. So ce1182]|uniref:hypothetical protein n=1 Tax=Sorangium sp. So ce1182 TaxID=3133334 RepID=UPI003F5DE9CA
MADWFNAELRPLGMPIFLVNDRPHDAVELSCRSAEQVASAFGVVRTRVTVLRDLALMLPTGFPLTFISAENQNLIISVSRELNEAENAALVCVLTDIGDPLPFKVRVTNEQPNPEPKPTGLELVPTRIQKHLPTKVRAFSEADEDFWRTYYRRTVAGSLRP